MRISLNYKNQIFHLIFLFAVCKIYDIDLIFSKLSIVTIIELNVTYELCHQRLGIRVGTKKLKIAYVLN
jgi:hypothetical protein